jgi:hypothetical protein
MCLLVEWLKAFRHLVRTAHRVVARMYRPRSVVEAENLFLRKQLALSRSAISDRIAPTVPLAG